MKDGEEEKRDLSDANDTTEAKPSTSTLADHMTTMLFSEYMERVDRGLQARKEVRDLLLYRLNMIYNFPVQELTEMFGLSRQ